MIEKMLVLAMLLAMPCVAVPENVTMGPYNVSFDLNLSNSTYDIEVMDPIQKESLGGDIEIKHTMKISDSKQLTKKIELDIKENNNTVVLSGSDMASAIRSAMKSTNYDNIQASTRIIDGKDGAIGVGEIHKIKVYDASYYPDENTIAMMVMTYPWEEGTLSFLKTLHIERAG